MSQSSTTTSRTKESFGFVNKLREIVLDDESASGKVFDLFIQVLILASLFSFAFETMPNLSDQTQRWLRFFEIFTVSVFTAEYVLRIILHKGKKATIKYVTSFYGIVDLLAILPFYISFGVDARSLRILRLFRLLRVLKLVKYHRALIRFKDAFVRMKYEFILFFILALVILFVSATGIYFFEHQAQPEAFKSIPHSLWWAVATLTTVGYGDIYPVTLGGKMFTFGVLMVGLSIVAVPTGLFSTALKQSIDNEDDSNTDQA